MAPGESVFLCAASSFCETFAEGGKSLNGVCSATRPTAQQLRLMIQSRQAAPKRQPWLRRALGHSDGAIEAGFVRSARIIQSCERCKQRNDEPCGCCGKGAQTPCT